MTISRIFNGTLQPDSYSLTSEIGDAIAFFIIAPDDTVDVQIDVFLQLELNLTDNRQIRLYEGLTEVDTRVSLTIPKEYQFTNTIKKFALYSSFTVNIEVYCIYQDKSIDTDKLDDIDDKLSQLQNNQIINTAINAAVATNQLQQNIAIGLLGASLSPITLGASLTVEPALITGTTALTTSLLLLTGG